MSRQLLLSLNGNKNGYLKKYLDDFNGEPRIAWYPSAGIDFRALLHLHPNYAKLHPANANEPASPDLFLFTDYFPWDRSTFLDSKIIYSDHRTTITVVNIEELPRLHLTLHEKFVDYPEGSSATDRAIFLKVKVESDILGSYYYHVLYAFAENVAFYCNKLAPNNAIISHIIHVRHGAGFGGGGKVSGGWLFNILHKLKCELFITDGDQGFNEATEFAIQYCPSIPNESQVNLTQIRFLHRRYWSNLDHITWNIVT